ncbi:acyl-CoA synthetase [soil metagenome]
MNPMVIAQTRPDHPATIMSGSGQVMTYAQLDDTARRFATVLRALGLRYGDHIALYVDNEIMYHPVAWGAWFAGLYFTPISTRLTPEEVRYIIADSGSQLVIASPSHEAAMATVRDAMPQVAHWYLTGPGTGLIPDIGPKIGAATPLEVGPSDRIGSDMLYSSGTTGRPKGIKPPLGATRDQPNPLAALLGKLYGFGPETRYLTPAPLYHGSPTKYSMAVHRFGGTNVIMEKFDAEAALATIARRGVTHSQWVPTMLQRLYRLPDEVKTTYDLSSHRVAIHAAAPCPPELKRAMIAWWGPIVQEFYAGSEAAGYTAIDSAEWLERPGSVGRSVFGDLHILRDDGAEADIGEIGQIYFANGPKFEYHNDPEKTARAYNDRGWVTLGDMGRLDEAGYLYLADRKDFMIISGGVNVYPTEVENLLTMHPLIEDVAVFGLPHEDLGEAVVAVIQPRAWPQDEAAFIADIDAFCRDRLSRIKSPRRIELARELPRQPNGKLYKKGLREQYLKAVAT